ncbi:ciliated left-right organizer metallopeptidase [Acomys russatus]|uniref:ciliated left-right organizer metallopeptidase n=1 Tax=Acomys russatus TaxID=60746 RepID=UPI0021E2B195|nr:ciliated left-right organizer metallopeptidase [Acomys russatus]
MGPRAEDLTGSLESRKNLSRVVQGCGTEREHGGGGGRGSEGATADETQGRLRRHGVKMRLLLLLGVATSRCLHDESQKSVRLLRPSFSQTPTHFRSSVLPLPASHEPQPLRIQTYYLRDPVSGEAWAPEAESRALAAVREAAQRIQGALAVLPVQGPLLLSRDPTRYCRAVWGDPDAPNYHRCSLLNPGYKGESCLGAKLPDAHLRGYTLWPEHGVPQLIQPDGPGVRNSDFLLYVRVAHTSKCHKEPSVIAYAACCQLDSGDRPLAGTIVYCAQHLTSPSLSLGDVVMATLHELLHALGFSGQLFKMWRDCPSGLSARGNCSTRKQVTRRDEWGQLLLATPAASHSLAKHLGVPGTSLGVPLEEEGSLSSHWESRLLQGSIMTATFEGAQRTRLDPVTLAAFEDSGWYQVNYSAAEELLWGRGAGLDFGLVSTCRKEPSDFFCTQSGLGCHYLHLDKGSCSSDPMLEGCRMYKPLTKGSECWKENGLLARAENPQGEIYHVHSRCFLANLTSQELSKDKTSRPLRTPDPREDPTGRCYLHQCTHKGAYEVRVEGSPWTPCLPGKAVQIPGYYGLLYCPRGRLCLGNEGTSAVTSSPTSLSTQDLLFQLSLRLSGTPGHSLGQEQREELAEVVLRALVTGYGTSRCYFHSPSITTALVFTVMLWKTPGCQGPSAAALHRALTLVLTEKPLHVHHGDAIFTTEHSKLPASLDHKPSTTGLLLPTGFCLLLLTLVGALGTLAYQKRATLQVGPATT